MISLIICSRTPNVSVELSANITETIGCAYELVVIDNSKNQYSIFSAYNEGVRRSKGDILCFMHDDVMYKTNGWGNIVSQVLSNQEIGCIGVVGTHYLRGDDLAWWNGHINSGRLIQGMIVNNEYKTELREDLLLKTDDVSEVASVDGMWMCIPRFLFDSVCWDEQSYNGFHGYDADMCMQMHQLSKKVLVVFNILIEHKSYGFCHSKQFDENSKIWCRKWAHSLPMFKGVESITQTEFEFIIKRFEEEIRMYKEQRKSFYKSYSYKIGHCILYPMYAIKKLCSK